MSISNREDIRPDKTTKDTKRIKCVVWDLDNTLWNGVLLEDEEVSLRKGVTSVVHALDARGILQSIASKNDYNTAMDKLGELGLREYFLYPQIGWDAKSSYITNIAKALNISVSAIAFIDDQPFEREEVGTSLPQVACYDADDFRGLLDDPKFIPRFVTEDSRSRRRMYINDMERNMQEEAFTGPKEEFLATLDMKLTIFSASEKDLHRAEELTLRTNQLNATGYSYSYDELNFFIQSEKHRLLMAMLTDRFGSYGHIGLALVEQGNEIWTIKLLLMSCRVMSRGVGAIMLNHMITLARKEGVLLRAEFLPNGKNRMMEITYRFAGFENYKTINDLLILENRLKTPQAFPDYVEIYINE
jgi:FkbH-like protein